MNTKQKKLLIALVSTIFLAAALIAVVSAAKSLHAPSPTISAQTHLLLKSTCGPTLYPDLCYSEIATRPGAAAKLMTKKDVIQKSLNITTTAVEHNYFTVRKLVRNKSLKLTKREKDALHDCLETIDETLDELVRAGEDLRLYPAKKSLTQHADDLKTLMSAAMTNQETCLDGFSHGSADKRVRRMLQKGQVYVERMCSNALAMIKNMTDTDIKNDMKTQKRQLSSEGQEWPHWLSGRDRRVLLEEDLAPDAVVAADGSGNYTTVTEAVEGAPEKSKKRYVIKIKAGVYRENVEVSKKKKNLMFVGDGRDKTIITASRNVVDGTTTFHSATVAVVGEGFLARDITFENTAGPAKHQAVALRVGSDLSAFYRCDILAYQDTLYAHSNRQFYSNCLIAGTVDFIFGNGAAVFQDCDIHARRPGSGQKNMVTAQGRKDPNQNTGIVIQKSRIAATSDLAAAAKGSFPTFLGRPWKEYSRTVVMQSNISDVIHPAGWHEWNATFAFDTLYYGEYGNGGAGANTSDRVKWSGLRIMDSEAAAREFTVENFIGGDNWLNSTGFPFSLGL